jgi:PIN domain nuclease of toxin-antitoxin system
MSRFVTDTHALYWHLTQDPKLSPTAQDIFRDADTGKNQILIPGIILIEMIYLVEKGRIDAFSLDKVLALLDVVDGSYSVAPLDHHTAKALQQVPRSAVPDMPDRIITATALQHNLPLITTDEAIQKSAIVLTVW